MKTAYIFHDAFCDPTSDWYPWMKTTLEQQGYFVVVPKFPTPAGQSYESWKSVMQNHSDKFDNETIFIGHGIGGTFGLRMTEELSLQIHGLFLVASYAEPLGHVGYDRVNETFINHTFDWQKIKNNVLALKVFAGEDDPFVPTPLTTHLAHFLETEPIIIPGGGHINKASGFAQCIPLAQGIKEGLGEIEKSMVVEVLPPLDSESLPLKEGDMQNAAAEETKIGSEAVAGSHTMYQDMSRLVNSNQGRVASALLTKAREEEVVKKINTVKNPINGLYLAGTFAVILATIGIALFSITRIAPAEKNNAAPKIISLLQSESHQKVDTAGKASYEIMATIREVLTKTPDSGTLHDIYYTRGNLRASFTDVLESLDLGDDIPESLRGEFIAAGVTDMPVFMHLSTSINGTPAQALVLPITHYDKTFSGFRDWEPTLFRDVGVFMNVSPEFLKTKITKDVFRSEMISNKDIRVFRENDLMLGYFFLNDRTVIIVNNVALIPEILTRFANSQIYK